MKITVGIIIGTIIGSFATAAATRMLHQTDTVYVTETFDRIVIEEKLTTIDLEELRAGIDDLDEQLYNECVLAIHHKTRDPKQGIINLIERHYDGDACRAADEALNGLW